MRVNFDANASIKPISEVLDCLANYRGEFLNPSSVHNLGQGAKEVLDEARFEIKALLNLRNSDKIIFTSGASEANNAALQTNFKNSNSEEIVLACSAVEHASVLECLRVNSKRGYKLRELSIAELNDLNQLKNILSNDLRIFSVMFANNETGQIFDVKSISKTIKEISPRSRIHCDAVQAMGKFEINFPDLGIESLSISGHKIGAMSGIGALIISEHCHLDPWIHGGPQEFGLRAGTENVLAIKCLGIACQKARKRLSQNDSRMAQAKAQLASFLNDLNGAAILNSFGNSQLPNTLSVRFPGIKADDLVVALDLNGVSISAGSACASGRPSPSHVLLAHGLTECEARETVRISLEPEISQEELTFGLSALQQSLMRMLSLKRAA